jgi:hypothetical protein
MGDDQDKQTRRRLPHTVVMFDDSWILKAIVDEAKRQARKVEQKNDQKSTVEGNDPGRAAQGREDPWTANHR